MRSSASDLCAGLQQSLGLHLLTMFIAMLILAAAAQPAAPRIRAPATVRILDSATASEAKWKLDKRRRERVIRDEHDRIVRLRTIDFE